MVSSEQAGLRLLTEILAAMPGIVVAYSGGADSAFLAEVAHRTLGERSLAATADSPSLPRRELDAARRLARDRGWRHLVVGTAELDDSRYTSNPSDRCYFCKSALFDRLVPLARGVGFPIALGTNVDDLSDHRPGQRAASERGGIHPMVEAGLSKAQIRVISSSLGLPTAEKPASACLASRFAYGVRITPEGLARIEAAEDLILARGFRVVRVRDLGGDSARVEVGREEVSRLETVACSLERALKELGFSRVEIDPAGYRQGALNEPIVLGRSSVSS